MGPLSIWIALTVIVWAVLLVVSRAVLKRSSNLSRASWIAIAAAVVLGFLLALKDSGDDPIPSFLMGQMIGSALFFVVPVAVAVVIEHRRRRSAQASRSVAQPNEAL